jgi:site-specific recombinase XerD
MPRRIVAAIMGHKDLNTTNRYSHVNDQMIGSEYGRWLEQQVQKNQQNSNKVGVV